MQDTRGYFLGEKNRLCLFNLAKRLPICQSFLKTQLWLCFSTILFIILIFTLALSLFPSCHFILSLLFFFQFLKLKGQVIHFTLFFLYVHVYSCKFPIQDCFCCILKEFLCFVNIFVFIHLHVFSNSPWEFFFYLLMIQDCII